MINLTNTDAEHRKAIVNLTDIISGGREWN